MSALPGVIGGAAAAYGAYALSSNVGTTAVVAVAGCLVADFMCRATKRALMGTSAGFWQTNVGRYLIGRSGRHCRVHGFGGGTLVSGDLRGGVLRDRADLSDRLESGHGNGSGHTMA